jgi:hypothetical protein
LPPMASLAPETLSVAVDVALEAAPDGVPDASVTVPSAVFPSENVTLPAGAVLPLEGVTVAVNCVVPAAAILTGLAAMLVMVATAAPVTVTVVEAVDPPKLPVGT